MNDYPYRITIDISSSDDVSLISELSRIINKVKEYKLSDKLNEAYACSWGPNTYLGTTVKIKTPVQKPLSDDEIIKIRDLIKGEER